MNQQTKKLFSIALAVLIGLGIIFFAWKGVFTTGNKITFDPTISGDSWKDSLLVVSNAFSTTTKNISQKGADATTTTDLVAREILLGYATIAGTTALGDVEAQAFAQELAEKLNAPKAKQYTLADIVVSNDNTPSANDAYAKKLIDTIDTFTSSRTKNDLEIVFSDPETNLKRNAEIDKLLLSYEKLVRELLIIKTPSSIATLHLRLTQGYANIGANLETMAEVYKDPLKALNALNQYRKEIDELAMLSEEYFKYFPMSN